MRFHLSSPWVEARGNGGAAYPRGDALAFEAVRVDCCECARRFDLGTLRAARRPDEVSGDLKPPARGLQKFEPDLLFFENQNVFFEF